MGRPKRFRNRIQFEMRSVRMKGVVSKLVEMGRREFGLSLIEARVLATRSTEWLRDIGVRQRPGQVRLSVPAVRCKKLSKQERCVAIITAVDENEDSRVWETYGLAALQRCRTVRWITEIRRQGGWANLTEIAAWANVTPTALSTRLRPLRALGVAIPHVGARATSCEGLLPEAWAVDRYLRTRLVEDELAWFGWTRVHWENVLRRFVRVLELARAGMELQRLGDSVGRSKAEVEQFLSVGKQHRRKGLMAELRQVYGARAKAPILESSIEQELQGAYGLSPIAARLYREELERLARETGVAALPTGRLVFFAIHADETARAKLHEARHVAVGIDWFVAADAAKGPYSESPTRVASMKLARILRYATQTRQQGALLTLPDLAFLMGIHVDAIRTLIKAHPKIVVPTRGRIKDIGRGVSHKKKIVSLYLQMHTETEIVDQTGHSYESVEAYLREFTRVMTLADRGMNAVMIRRVTGRSMALVEAYLQLYREYDDPDYHFRLAQLRGVFAGEGLARAPKKGAFPFPTKDTTP